MPDMASYRISSTTLRFMLLITGSVLWLGTWLADLGGIAWLLYLPATLALFAATTGICPSLVLSRLLLPSRITHSR